MTCSDLKEHIDDVVTIMNEMKKEKGMNPVPAPRMPTAKCTICQGEFPVRELASLILCRNCYSVAVLSWEEAKREYAYEEEKKRKVAAEITGGGTDEG